MRGAAHIDLAVGHRGRRPVEVVVDRGRRDIDHRPPLHRQVTGVERVQVAVRRGDVHGFLAVARVGRDRGGGDESARRAGQLRLVADEHLGQHCPGRLVKLVEVAVVRADEDRAVRDRGAGEQGGAGLAGQRRSIALPLPHLGEVARVSRGDRGLGRVVGGVTGVVEIAGPVGRSLRVNRSGRRQERGPAEQGGRGHYRPVSEEARKSEHQVPPRCDARPSLARVPSRPRTGDAQGRATPPASVPKSQFRAIISVNVRYDVSPGGRNRYLLTRRP